MHVPRFSEVVPRGCISPCWTPSQSVRAPVSPATKGAVHFQPPGGPGARVSHRDRGQRDVLPPPRPHGNAWRGARSDSDAVVRAALHREGSGRLLRRSTVAWAARGALCVAGGRGLDARVGARPTGRGTCLSASGVHARRKQLRRTRGALLGPRCPVPPLAVSPLTFPVGKIGTECPRHFQGPPSLPDRTIAGQGPFCPRQASLHHGMLIRLRPQSTPTEQVHTGRLTLHPPRAGRLTLRTHGGRTGPAVWRELVGAPRTPLRATCTIPASASRPLRCHERAPGRLPGAGPVCSRPEEHGDGPVCHAGLRPVSPSPSASLRLCILLFNPGLCSLRFKLKYPEQM